jgi:hypothetical protein
MRFAQDANFAKMHACENSSPQSRLSSRQRVCVSLGLPPRRRLYKTLENAMRFMRTQYGANKLTVLLTSLVITGCATTTVSNRQSVASGYVPRPAQVWVYPFAATPADVPPESDLAGQSSADTAPQTSEQIAEGRKLGTQIATDLVQQINAMGMPASMGSAATRPQLNDIVIEGSILSIQQGSAAARIAIGFSAGASELKVAVEGFQMTATGLRKLGSGDVGSTGNKTPGSAVGLAVLIATHNPAGLIVSTGMKVYGEESGSNTIEGRATKTAQEIAGVLKTRFQQEGWIQP